MNIEILYEDNHLLVAVKPAGILSQEDSTKDMDMLTMLKRYLKDKYQKPGNVYLGLVHRLDRMTSGIMVFAKTSKAAARLNEQIKTNQFIKKYYAVAKGKVPNYNRLENYLFKDEIEIKSYVGNANNGKLAILEYNVLKNIDEMSLLDIKLITGRHHQIRVQFANIGYPLVGDSLYGKKQENNIMLHAYYLSFYHPITKEQLEFIKKPSSSSWNKFFE